MKTFLPEISASLLKRFRFMVGGVAVFFAVLLPGALWYKGAQRSVASTAALEATTALQSRVEFAAQSIGGSLDLVTPWLWSDSTSLRNKDAPRRIRRDLPFDIVTLFTHERQFYDGFRGLSDGSGAVDLTPEAVNLLFAPDSGLLDRVTAGQTAAGLITVEDKPLLVSARRLLLAPGDVSSGFLLVGRWLKPEHLSSGQGPDGGAIAFFSLANDVNIPEDVQRLIPAVQRNKGFLYNLDGDGRGKLYSIINDMSGRAALLADSQWQAPWRATGTLGFGIFFSSAAVAGVGTWALLLMGDARSRRRVRRFDGLESLSVDQVKVLVEAFPGYAFVLNSSSQYVAVSRILAGVTAHEPSYFVGQNYGVVASEESDKPFEKLFAELRNPNRWPRTADLQHKVEGLGEQFEFSGSAHFLSKQELVLVILNGTIKGVAKAKSPRMGNPPQINQKSNVA